MPIFFIISGYFFTFKHQETLPFKIYFVKKIKTLLIPYIIIGLLLYYPLYIVNHDVTPALYIKQVFFYNDNTEQMVSAFWFLTALFIANILYYLLVKYLQTKTRVSIIICLSTLAIFNGNISLIHLPFSANAGIIGLVSCLIGRFIRNSEIKKRYINYLFNLNIFVTIILTFLVIKLIKYNILVDMKNSCGNFLLFYLNVILSYIIIINYSKYILNFLNITKLSLLLNWLLHIGKNSIFFVCFNFPIIIYFKFEKLLSLNCLIAFKFLSVIIIITVLSLIINKTKLRFIVGKTKNLHIFN